MKKILVACPSIKSPFVAQDVDSLKQSFAVNYISFDTLSNPKTLSVPITVLRKLIFKRYDALLIWFSIPKFSAPLSFIAKLFGKKVFVIAGGYDITYVPEIDWGEMGIWWKRLLQRFSFFWTDHIFAFSDFSKSDIIKYTRPDKVSTLYFGIDTDFFSPEGSKENLVITTCFNINKTSILQKGLNYFRNCAEALPEYNFIVIGQIDKNDAYAMDFYNCAPKNLSFTNRFVGNEELRDYYRKAKIYIQASAHEGFGIAVAEAMACQCIPIGAINTSLDEVIGNPKYIANFKNIDSVIELIRSIMISNNTGADMRQRVSECFKPIFREKNLNTKIKNILKVI